MISCTNVKKVYGQGANQVFALNGIDLSVEKGEFTAIVGASGSGKSTLLYILGSVDRVTSGTVTVYCIDVGKLDATQAAIFRLRNVGLIYQFYNLIPTLPMGNSGRHIAFLPNDRPSVPAQACHAAKQTDPH